jgi:bacterioferritin (cytochrome b1)
MITCMEKRQDMTSEAMFEELLKNKEKVIEGIKNSPAVLRKQREAIEQLSKLKPPFPWDEDRHKEAV